MKPHELKPPRGARKARKRVGRGEGSGVGKTAGRGTKGTKARGRVRPFFEGGQMPLTRRVPKLKGFKPPTRKVFDPVNVADLARIESAEIGPDEFRSAGLTSRHAAIKVLGSGDIDRAVTVRAHAFSKSAKSKIETAGGKAEIVETKEGRAK